MSVNWTHNLPLQRRTLYHWVIAAPAKSSSPMPRCQENAICSWGVTEKPKIRERIKLALTIYRDFMQNFYQILRGQYKPKTTGVLTFLGCGRMTSLSFVQRTFDCDGCNGFVCRGRCRDWSTIGPK